MQFKAGRVIWRGHAITQIATGLKRVSYHYIDEPTSMKLPLLKSVLVAPRVHRNWRLWLTLYSDSNDKS
jgi:hypothetical protein